MTPEGKIKAAVKRKLNSLYECYHHWPVQTGMGAPTLDCVGCYRGMFFAIETKAPGKVPTARQEHTIEEMAGAGACVMVISSMEGVENIGKVLEACFNGESAHCNPGS